MSKAIGLLAVMLAAFGAQASNANGGLNLDLVSMVLSLALVIAMIIGLAFLAKKLNPNLVQHDDFKVIRSISLGTKERLLVVEIDNKQHLLGVTPHAINYLYELQTPLTAPQTPALAEHLSQLLKTKQKTQK